MHHRMAKIPQLKAQTWNGCSGSSAFFATSWQEPRVKGRKQLNHSSQVTWCLCLHFRIDLRQAHAGVVFSALEIGLAFIIFQKFQKAKSLLDPEMLCFSFQINFYVVTWTEWNLWCWWKNVCLWKSSHSINHVTCEGQSKNSYRSGT